jgi:hypothetical protein
MYVRSHIENVSGINKYIYINADDSTKKKYIRENNIYYPVKKYNGVLKRIKNSKNTPKSSRRAGGANGDIQFTIKIYDNTEEGEGEGEESQKPINTIITNDINITDGEVLKTLAAESKGIMPNKDIHIINKNYNNIRYILNKIMIPTDAIYGINHFVIIEEEDGKFKVYIRKQPTERNTEPQDIADKLEDINNKLSSTLKYCYHVIYKRNNNITKHPNEGAKKEFIVIFSILKNGIDNINEGYLKDNYTKYEDDKIYNALYTKLIDTLPKLFNNNLQSGIKKIKHM